MTHAPSQDIEFIFTTRVVQGSGELTFATDANDHGEYARAIRDRWAPSAALSYCLETLAPTDVFVDVGANLGEFALPIAKLGVATLAIEALASNVQLLKEGARRSGVDHLVTVHGAAGDVLGKVRVAGHSAWGYIAGSDIDPEFTEEVRAVRLDDLLETHGFLQPRLIKIDVEGSERAVLRGMERTLALPDLELVIESNSFYGHDYRELLEDIEGYGFNLYLFHARTLVPRTSADSQESCVADYLATRRKLEGIVGSFVCRELAIDESIALLQIDLEAGPPHRRHLSGFLDSAPAEVLQHQAVAAIRRRLAEFPDARPEPRARTGKDRLRIAWVVHQYGAEVGGGSETLCRTIAELLVDEVDSTVLTTTSRDYDPWEGFYPAGETSLNGVRVIRFPADQAPAAELRALYDDAHAHPTNAERGRLWLEALGPRAPGLVDHLREHGGDYDVLCAVPYVFTTTLAALEAFAAPKILVPCAHDEPAFGLDVYRRVFDLADALAFNTDEEAVLVEQRFGTGGKPAKTIGMPIRPHAADPSLFRAQFGIEGPYLLCIGRIDVSKGTDLLLDLHERTSGATPHHTLVLVGQQIIDVPARSDVVVAGYLDDQSKASAIAGAAAVVLPSLYESLSIVALEAWTQGIPVLANAETPALFGQVRRSGGGLWYRDAHDYRMMVTLLLAQPVLGRGLGEAGRSWVDETYAPDTVVAAWRSLLSELALGSRAPA